MDKFESVWHKMEKWVCQYPISLTILLMMVYVTANVIGRYGFRFPIRGMSEYVGIMLVPVTFLYFSYAWYRKGTFVTVNILPMKLRGKALWINQFIIYLAALVVFAGVLLYGTTVDLIGAIADVERAGNLGYYTPMWPWKLTMVIGCFMLTVRILLDLLYMIRTGKTIPLNRGMEEA